MGKDIKGKELGEGIYQRKNGLYSARYRGRDGERHEKCSKKLSEVKKWLRDIRYKDEHDSIYSGAEMKVNTWFWFWLDEIKRDSIRHGTRSAYINRYNARIREVIGGMPVGDVKPMHCQMVINQSANAGECEESMKKTRVIMKAIFEAAVDNMMIEKNPVTKIVKIPRREKKERRVLAKSEQDRFVEMAKDSAHYDEYRFVLETGVRCGELCGLQWENVDLKNRRISIEHSLEYRTDIQEFVNNPPKSSSGYRMIPLTNTAYNILVNRQESQKHMEIPEEYQGLVFLNCNGNPTHRGIYNRALKQIAKDMDVPSFSMHSLRHTFATRCIEAGVRPKSLQKLMGHSEIGITMDLYVHATDEEAVNEMRKLETYFSSDYEETEESDE